MAKVRAWKDFERYVAKQLGGKRIPVSTANSSLPFQGDVEHDRFYIECKNQQRWRTREWLLDTMNAAQKTKKIPILVMGSGCVLPPVVVIRLRDFAKLKGVKNNENKEESI